uniref:Secreted protein n=1 Tax=Steinernema glaseri TaxID=37863 RepID=A0A1I7Y8E5_9BILA
MDMFALYTLVIVLSIIVVSVRKRISGSRDDQDGDENGNGSGTGVRSPILKSMDTACYVRSSTHTWTFSSLNFGSIPVRVIDYWFCHSSILVNPKSCLPVGSADPSSGHTVNISTYR